MRECLRDETIAAYIDGALAPGEIDRADHHVDVCASCRAQLSAVVERLSPTGSVAEAIARATPGEPLADVAIGRYIVERVIGRGGMGVVVRARDPELERPIAIKLLDPVTIAALPSRSWRARLRDEARAMARLRHPNVVTVYDVGTVGNQVFVAMELVDGESLAQHLANDRASALQLCIAAGRGLCAAHAAGLAHGDVKPDNILVDRDGRALIGDFGLARVLAEDPERRALVGTPAYMAPELLRRHPADARSDQFAFAVTVYEACTGGRPWHADSLDDQLHAVEHEPLMRPVGMSRAVWRVVARGLAADPEARFPSLQRFVNELERASRRARPRIAAIAVAAIAVIGGAAVAARAPDPGCVDPIERTEALAIACDGSAPCAALSAELTRRAADWRHTHVAVCEASKAGTQSDRLLDRRMHCLDERLLDHAALVRRLPSPMTNTGAFDGLAALQRLDPPERCATSDRAFATVSPAKVPALVEANGWLALARADLALGHYTAGRDAIAPRLAAIEALGDPSLLASAELAAGELQMHAGQLDAAEASFDRGLHAAADAGDDRATAELLLRRGYLVGELRKQWPRGAELLRAAEVAIVRAGKPPELEALLELDRGFMAEETGDVAAALQHFTRAYERHPEALALEHMCGTEYILGKHADGRAHCEAALRMVRTALGDDHPDVAKAEANLAGSLYTSGDLAGARSRWQHALASLEHSFGDRSPELAIVLLDLCDVSRELGDPASADRYLARAEDVTAAGGAGVRDLDVKIRLADALRTAGKDREGLAMLEDLARRAEATLGMHDATVRAFQDLGIAYFEDERYPDARDAFTKAVDAATRMYGAASSRTLILAVALGRAMIRTHDARSARPLFERAVFTLEAQARPDAPELADAETSLAECLIELGDAQHAVDPAAKAVAILEYGRGNPLSLAEARVILANAAWRAHRPDAAALVHAARAEMRALGARASELSDVESLLRRIEASVH